MDDELKKMLVNLPHGDRICELHGICTCGRDKTIAEIEAKFAKLQDYYKASQELLTIREEQIGDFLADEKGFRSTLKWISDNDPKGKGDPYWYSEQCSIRAKAALDDEN
jgi:hypothetical protein